MSIPGGNSAELCAVLDGEVERGLYGYCASTDERVLYVPHAKAADAAEAVLLCRRGGLLRSKLDSMTAEDAHYTYLTTIPKRDPES